MQDPFGGKLSASINAPPAGPPAFATSTSSYVNSYVPSLAPTRGGMTPSQNFNKSYPPGGLKGGFVRVCVHVFVWGK